MHAKQDHCSSGGNLKGAPIPHEEYSNVVHSGGQDSQSVFRFLVKFLYADRIVPPIKSSGSSKLVFSQRRSTAGLPL
jgi:hypothetical protein